MAWRNCVIIQSNKFMTLVEKCKMSNFARGVPNF